MALTPEAFAGKLGVMVKGVESLQRTAVAEGAQIIKVSVFAAMAARGLESHRLRNVGKKGSKLGVHYKLVKFAGEDGAVIKATGPWQIVERNTKPHLIGGGRSKKTEKRSYLQFVSGDFRLGPISHPGTQGKHAWRAGVLAARKPVGAVYQKQMGAVVRKLF